MKNGFKNVNKIGFVHEQYALCTLILAI